MPYAQQLPFAPAFAQPPVAQQSPYERVLTERTDEGGQSYYPSNYGTVFERHRAVEQPWVRFACFAEMANGGTPVGPEVRSIPIASTSGDQRRMMVRVYHAYLWQVQITHDSDSDAFSSTATLPQHSSPRTLDEAERFKPKHSSSSYAAAEDSSQGASSSRTWQNVIRTASALPANVQMTAPSDALFDTAQMALDAVQQYCLRHGYFVSVKSSSGAGRFYYLQCYKSGEPRSRHPGTLGSSRKTNCPWRARIYPSGNGFFFEVDHDGHNHPVDREIGCLYERQLSRNEIDNIVRLRAEAPNTTPKHILGVLNEQRAAESKAPVSDSKLISNAYSRHQAWIKEHDIPLDQLLIRLQQSDPSSHLFVVSRQRSTADHLEAIFVTHPRVFDIVRAGLHVLAIDATYCVDQHAFPLIQMVTVLPWGKPLTIAWALVEHETTDSYIWVLGQLSRMCKDPIEPEVIISDNCKAATAALRAVFPTTPSLLCTWHATQNVKTSAWMHLSESEANRFIEDWSQMLNTLDEAEADKLWDTMQEVWEGSEGGSEAIRYVRSSWRHINVWPKIALCHAKRLRHYGVRTTGMVESTHASLKSSLPSTAKRRKQSFKDILQRIEVWSSQTMIAQGKELRKQQTTQLWIRQESWLDKIRGKVAHEAMSRALDELAVAQRRLGDATQLYYALHHACTADIEPRPAVPYVSPQVQAETEDKEACYRWSATGIPCRHRILFMLLAGCDSFEQTDFSSFHWLPENIGSLPEDVELMEEKMQPSDVAGQIVDMLLGIYGGQLPLNAEERVEGAVEAACNAFVDHTAVDPPPSSQRVVRKTPPPASGRTMGKQSHAALKRQLTQAERKEKEVKKQRRSHRCGKCGEEGHDRSRCPYEGRELQDKMAAWTAQKKAQKAAKEKERRSQKKGPSLPADLAAAVAEEVLHIEKEKAPSPQRRLLVDNLPGFGPLVDDTESDVEHGAAPAQTTDAHQSPAFDNGPPSLSPEPDSAQPASEEGAGLQAETNVPSSHLSPGHLDTLATALDEGILTPDYLKQFSVLATEQVKTKASPRLVWPVPKSPPTPPATVISHTPPPPGEEPLLSMGGTVKSPLRPRFFPDAASMPTPTKCVRTPSLALFVAQTRLLPFLLGSRTYWWSQTLQRC